MQESDDMEELIEEFRREFFMGGEVLNGFEEEFVPGFNFVGYELAPIL